MINLNEITKEVIDNVKSQGKDWFDSEIKSFMQTEMIGSMFTNVAMGCETLAIASLADPQFVSAVRTLMWASYQVGKLAGRQELMDETMGGFNWEPTAGNEGPIQ